MSCTVTARLRVPRDPKVHYYRVRIDSGACDKVARDLLAVWQFAIGRVSAVFRGQLTSGLFE
jgi:hypothetical protein